MPGKLNLYNLGDLGVHLVETPVHSPDGSFTSAQNASVSRDQGQHGLRKRHGMAKLNATALNGAILAIGNMPFQDPFGAVPSAGERAFANEYNEGPTGTFITTTNGTTWATAGADRPNTWGSSVFADSFTQRGGVISTDGLITYLNSSADIYTFNGTTNTLLASGFSLGSFGVRSGPVLHDGVPVFVVYDATSGKLLRQNGTGIEELTASIGKPATCVMSAIGRVYIGTDENRIYYWSESEGLVLDITLSPTGGNVSITDIAHVGGVIYASACTKAGGATATTHKVLKRTADATWSDITPTAQGDYGPLAAFGTSLYCVRKAHDAFAGCEIRAYDGTSWTTDQNVVTLCTGANRVISLVAFNSALYGTVGGTTTRDVIRRSGGTWTRVHTEAILSTNYYTALGFY
jgi:hypothetical protein